MRMIIPRKREIEVLFLNRHTCCICRDKSKDVHIHHIDGDNSNHSLGNLAVLCLDCHSRVTGTRGLGRRFSTVEVKRYKQEWELVAKKIFGLPSTGRPRQIPKIERQLFIFEIKRIIYEMLSVDDSNRSQLEAGFETLFYLSILEGLQREILEHLGYAFVLSAIREVNKPVILARSLPRIFGYLVGPADVDFRKSDKKNLIEAINILMFCLELCVEENKKYQILTAIKAALSEFMQIAILYRNPKVFVKARNVLDKLEESSITPYHKGQRKLLRLSREIDTLRQDIRKELKRTKLKWKINSTHTVQQHYEGNS